MNFRPGTMFRLFAMALAMVSVLLARALPHDTHASCADATEHGAGAEVSAQCGICDLSSTPAIAAGSVTCAPGLPLGFEMAVPEVIPGVGISIGATPGRGPPVA